VTQPKHPFRIETDSAIRRFRSLGERECMFSHVPTAALRSADEALTFRSLGATAIILGGAVVLITTEAGTRSADVVRSEPIAGTSS